jgi:hypothetical protein
MRMGEIAGELYSSPLFRTLSAIINVCNPSAVWFLFIIATSLVMKRSWVQIPLRASG